MVHLDDVDLDGLIKFLEEDIKKSSYKKYCIADDNDVCYYDYVVLCGMICDSCGVDFGSALKIARILVSLNVFKIKIHNGDELYAI